VVQRGARTGCCTGTGGNLLKDITVTRNHPPGHGADALDRQELAQDRTRENGSVQGTEPETSAPAQACRLLLSGRVQGVGFRPFVYRLAQSLHLCGWVRNRLGRVEIHIEGKPESLHAFMRRLFQQVPPLAEPRLDSCTPAGTEALHNFTIRESTVAGSVQIHVPPDLFTCDACLAELYDPADRRWHYPFINCTQCGPRYTLIHGMPYDRATTTMAVFPLCEQCREEYTNPADRRFHAEPIACPACGPTLTFQSGNEQCRGNSSAMQACLTALRTGHIVAIKGIGGYHLMCDARHDTAIRRLRMHKPRPHKPLAVLFPAPPDAPLRHLEHQVRLSPAQAELLLSPARPIVLARRLPTCDLSELVAPGLDEIGVMLPYSPLHHLLLNEFGGPLIATSANISGEPVLTENREVTTRLGHVCDAFLHHDRPIARPADDPVYRELHGLPRPLRSGRGTAPLERKLPFRLVQPVLATGGHMKNTLALAWDDRVVMSPHIGDMGNARSLTVFEQTVKDLQSLYGVTASLLLCDAHPGYATSRWAERSGLPVQRIFHHQAHAAAAVAETGGQGDWLVFTWDGVGYGEDGTLWGGEALLGHPGNWQRFASLRPFHLPGGERAAREPWRSAAAVCWETGYAWPGIPRDAEPVRHAWARRLNTPQTTAAGRLFDAAAALTGLCNLASFEGQGPMLLEARCGQEQADPVSLPLLQTADRLWVSDWEPLLPVLLDESRPVAQRAACFHTTLAHALLAQALQARDRHGIRRIGLSGGVFQNRVLTDSACDLLADAGFDIALPGHIPVNDAGISYGQVIEFGSRVQN
jgi:hydrogenase maturation protein HypF